MLGRLTSRAAVAAVTLAVASGVFIAPASADPAMTALGYYTIFSGNQCAGAGFDYSYYHSSTVGGRKAYVIHLTGEIFDECTGDQYGGVIQRKGWELVNGSWSHHPGGASDVFATVNYKEGISYFNDSPFFNNKWSDLHFRVCNKGPTGNIGTCGAWTGE